MAKIGSDSRYYQSCMKLKEISMKKLISVLVVACFFLISLASAGSARVYNEPGKHQVGASIGQDEYGLVRESRRRLQLLQD